MASTAAGADAIARSSVFTNTAATSRAAPGICSHVFCASAPTNSRVGTQRVAAYQYPKSVSLVASDVASAAEFAIVFPLTVPPIAVANVAARLFHVGEVAGTRYALIASATVPFPYAGTPPVEPPAATTYAAMSPSRLSVTP
jgi:hypothetical protein